MDTEVKLKLQRMLHQAKQMQECLGDLIEETDALIMRDGMDDADTEEA